MGSRQHFLPLSFSHRQKSGISVGRHIYLWTRHPSPVHWLMTSPSLNWFCTHNNAENKRPSPCQASYLLFVSICLSLCASSSLQNPKCPNDCLCIVYFTLSITDSRITLETGTTTCGAGCTLLNLTFLPPVFILSFPFLWGCSSYAVQHFFLNVWGEWERWEREKTEVWARESGWHVKTTGNKSSQINLFHRRCSQSWPQNMETRERTKDYGLYKIKQDGWMDGWKTFV